MLSDVSQGYTLRCKKHSQIRLNSDVSIFTLGSYKPSEKGIQFSFASLHTHRGGRVATPVMYLSCKGQAVITIVYRGADDEGVAAVVNKDGIDLIHNGKVQRASDNLR